MRITKPQPPKPVQDPVEQIKTHGRLLKGPLLITASIVAVLAVATIVTRMLSPSRPPAIREALAPATELKNLVFFREGDAYGLYFTLYDANGNEVARTGEVSFKITQIGKVGMEGGPQFLNKISLLEATFDAGLASFQWMEIEGGVFFSKRRLILPKRIPANAFKRKPPPAALCLIEVQFRDARSPASVVSNQKTFLFPS